MLDQLAPGPTPNTSTLQTPDQTSKLELALLHSSPPEGTELQQSNRVFHCQICIAEGRASPAKRFAKRTNQALESTQSELATLRKRVDKQEQPLHPGKLRETGKRVALEGNFEFSTQEVR